MRCFSTRTTSRNKRRGRGRAPSGRPEPNRKATQGHYARALLAQAGTATFTRLHKHGSQRQRPTAPQRRRRARPPTQQQRQCPRTMPHHRATPPTRTDAANPHHDRRSTPKKPKFWMTAPPAKTRKRPPCRCLVCASQHPWAAVGGSSSIQEAPQGADDAGSRSKTPLR